MDSDIGARRVQMCGNLGADAPCGARHQCDTAFDCWCAAHLAMINLTRRQFFAGHVIKATF